jgi:hypothetical protein
MIRRSIGFLGSLLVGSFVVVGCAGAGEDTDSADGALTPCTAPGATGATCPKTLDDQRAVCEKRVAENGAFRDKDIDVGVVRWKCGDVAGVTKTDLGQEYCEFHAIQDGSVVDKTAKNKLKPVSTDHPVECLFTGVYGDVKGAPGSSKNKDFGNALNKALTDTDGNLKNAKGVTLAAQGNNPLSVMNGQFNSRGAATKLISDCSEAAADPDNKARVNKADDTEHCAADGSGCESARDVEACTLVTAAGVGWRNSDPIICGRAARGALCGTTYSALPNALDGFIMTDWKADLAQAVKLWSGKSNDAPDAPQNCRYATVNGKPYLHMMICTAPATAVNNPKYEGQLQQMCSDTFGPSIAMTAPIGLVAKTAPSDDKFCGEFDKGVAAIQSVAK